RLVTPWSAARTSAIDATLVAWTVLAAALIAAVSGSERALPRSLAILACVLMCLGGPLLALLPPSLRLTGGLTERLLWSGPRLEVHGLSAGGGTPPDPVQWRRIALVGGAGVAAWALAGAAILRRGRRAATPRQPAEAGIAI